MSSDAIRWADKSQWLIPPQQGRSRKTLGRIIDAAVQLFTEKGYEHTSIMDISRVSGVSVGAMYARFADKDAILHTVLASYYQTRAAQFDRLTDPALWQDKSAVEVVRFYITIIFSSFRQDAGMLRVAERQRLSNPHVAQCAARINAHVANRLAEMLAPHAGKIGGDVRLRALYLHNIVRNAVVLAVLHDGSPVPSALALDSDEFEAEALAMALAYLGLNG